MIGVGKKKNPLLEKKYNEGAAYGYDQGFADAKRKSAALFAVKLERLEEIKGIGEQTMAKIVKSMQEDLTEGEQQKAEHYVADMLEKEWRESGWNMKRK